MKYYCNPINVPYHYQFNLDPQSGQRQICREAADPSMICFKGRYYIFASMNLSVWVSDDLVTWESKPLPENLPLYDYAPDVRVVGDYVYFCASKRGEICNHYRTKDIENGPYEEIPGTFDFWDPNLFLDDDGRMYFYWGCSNMTPIWGVELDPETMRPLGDRIPLIEGKPFERGYERSGEDHTIFPRPKEEVDRLFRGMLARQGMKEEDVPENMRDLAWGYLSDRPYIEGPWMTRYQDRYYLQYACPGTQYNVYGDGVYISDSPLGPFEPADNNPFSYHPGGFMPGAGHGSTMWDLKGRLWHVSTMQISVHHNFERRVGLWPAGFDADGELFCNQRYGDWPIPADETDPWAEPDWFLLSYRRKVTASSFCEGHAPENAVDENSRTWWRASSSREGEWLCLDLGEIMDVRAVQINFADDQLEIASPGEMRGTTSPRYIDEILYPTRWKLEGSADGAEWSVIEDKSDVTTDLSHDLVVREGGLFLRYLRLTIRSVPYDQPPCISGLRVFGRGNRDLPAAAEFTARRSEGRLDLIVSATAPGEVVGFNILWGHRKDKLYHSCTVYGTEVKEKRIGALVADQEYYVRVDTFNENGIAHSEVRKLSSTL